MTIQINKTTSDTSETVNSLLELYKTLGELRLSDIEGKYEIKVDIKKIE